MSYSIKPVLHNTPDKSGLQKIQIQIIYKRKKVIIPTDLRCFSKDFTNGRLKNFANANKYNRVLIRLINETEAKLLDIIAAGGSLSELKESKRTENMVTFCGLINKIIETRRLSAGRVKHYKTVLKEIMQQGDFEAKALNESRAIAYEKYITAKGLNVNTINAKMRIFLSVSNYAVRLGLCNKYYYSPPRYEQGVPFYLSESQVQDFKAVTLSIKDDIIRLSGLFFLLSCYTGFRVSDLKKFDSGVIKNNTIPIRAQKNGNIVSIPVYKSLQDIIDLIGDDKIYFTENTMRLAVKEIAKMAGIKMNVKLHTGRHTFAMMLMEKGFSIDEAATLLGDSKQVAKVYARITNKRIDRLVLERLR